MKCLLQLKKSTLIYLAELIQISDQMILKTLKFIIVTNYVILQFQNNFH